MNEKEQLEAGIAALEAQRSVLGEAVVDTATAPLRTRLDALRSEGWTGEPAQRLKQVTVLFTDVVGSTAMGRTLDPEDIHAIMDGALERLTTVVHAHHGRVLQYSGDGLLAAFGADEAREEDPENAVRAGLAILEEARQLAREARDDHAAKAFDVRVGIDTGRVLLGGGVDADNSIRGTTVNIAARMEQSAPAGGLRISHNTYRHVRGVFDVSEEPPIEVKGIEGAVRSYLVRRAKPRAFRVASRGIDGVETPMVGRQAELTKLTEAFKRLYNAGAGQGTALAITVVADAGLGKSRLLNEFENWVETWPETYYVFKGRAQPQSRQQPYGLLRDLLTWRLRIADSDSAEVARQKLSASLAPVFDDNGAGQVEVLGHLIGLDYSKSPHLRGILDDSEQIRSRGFHAAAHIFRHLATSAGTSSVLLLDDLHWADDDSLDFITYLLDVNRDVPMLVIGLARPELFDRRPDWSGASTRCTRIDLLPLGRQHSRELANVLLQKLQEIPAALRELITSAAEGNPFYMEELIKMLIDDGAIVSDADHWRVVPDKLMATRVPTTLTGVLQARLDSLAPAERTALQQASVIGFVFWDRALAGLDAGAIESLATLTRRELIVPQASSAFTDAREYTFQHHLLHQVTYDSVLKKEKRNYHAGAAAWLEKVVSERGGEYVGAMAEHYERAGEVARATDYYALAAEGAAARHAREATLDYARRALALAPAGDHANRWRALAAREKILATQDDRPAHDADLDALEAVADALEDDARRAEAALRRASAVTNAGNYPMAERVSRTALALAERAGAVAIAVRAYTIRAFALRRMGDFGAAQAVAEAGLSLAQQCDDRAAESELLANLGGLAAERGDLVAGGRLIEKDLSIAREIGDKARETTALNLLGDQTMRLGDYAGARGYLEESLRLSRAIGHRYGECIVLLNLAAVAHLQGDDDAAVECARASIDIAVPSGARDLEAAALLPLGLAELARGEFDAARAALERSRDLFEQNAGPHLALEPVAGLARLALLQRNPKEAMDCAQMILAHLGAAGTLDGTEEPLRIRLICQQVLASARDPGAGEMLASLHAELLARAERITDDKARLVFLRDVPHNREIVEAWSASGIQTEAMPQSG